MVFSLNDSQPAVRTPRARALMLSYRYVDSRRRSEGRLVQWMPAVRRRDCSLLLAGFRALSILATACAGAVPEGGGPATSAPVRDLSSIATLQARFNHDAGMVRLILLLSPT